MHIPSRPQQCGFLLIIRMNKFTLIVVEMGYFIAKGKFPEPFKLIPGGRAAGWLETTVDDWIESREQLSRDNNTK